MDIPRVQGICFYLKNIFYLKYDYLFFNSFFFQKLNNITFRFKDKEKPRNLTSSCAGVLHVCNQKSNYNKMIHKLTNLDY